MFTRSKGIKLVKKIDIPITGKLGNGQIQNISYVNKYKWERMSPFSDFSPKSEPLKGRTIFV